MLDSPSPSAKPRVLNKQYLFFWRSSVTNLHTKYSACPSYIYHYYFICVLHLYIIFYMHIFIIYIITFILTLL